MQALIRWPRLLWRSLCAITWVLWGLWVIRRQFPRLQAHERSQRIGLWSQRMLRAMGVRLRMDGPPPVHGPVLRVSNHLSWLDILVMNAVAPSRFVSKAEVKHWPLIGSLTVGAGTLLIERDKRRDAMRVVHHMAESLQAGDAVAVFPEGTTSDGQALLPFHANLLQAAVTTDAPVHPWALSYRHAHTGEAHQAPVFVGDTTLVASLLATLLASHVVAEVRLGEVQCCNGRDRRAWAEDLHRAVNDLRR
jgi:1-acyl-sn-glycerol-3-phosphate acyltransferase